MQTSESIKEISAALVFFHSIVPKIAKDANNPFFKSKYASLSGILETISDPLVKSGLAIVQLPENENGLTTRLLHTSGEWMEATYTMKPKQDTPQDRGSAITYQRRYAVGAILSLNIDDDDDGNAASGRIDKKEVVKETPNKKNTPTEEEKALLRNLVYSSILEDDKRLKTIARINGCKDYDDYQKIQHGLEALQVPFDQKVNPSKKDINKELLRKTA